MIHCQNLYQISHDLSRERINNNDKKKLLEDAYHCINSMTETEIISDKKLSDDPLLHVVINSAIYDSNCFDLFKLFFPKFNKYWNSQNYLNKNKQTIYQKITQELHLENNQIVIPNGVFIASDVKRNMDKILEWINSNRFIN